PKVSPIVFSVNPKVTGPHRCAALARISLRAPHSEPPDRKNKLPMKHFSELPISPYMQERLAAARFSVPTPVQAATIPVALEGKDVLASAQTGTGNTLAFLVPIMEQLLTHAAPGMGALVFPPAGELAL